MDFGYKRLASPGNEITESISAPASAHSRLTAPVQAGRFQAPYTPQGWEAHEEAESQLWKLLIRSSRGPARPFTPKS